MSSVDNLGKVRAGTTTDKDAGHPVSVRFPDARLEKLVRKAAVELNTSRSAFIVEGAIRLAREVLKLQREADFQAYLDAA
jgi:uncharacterized protein (DUF1778 family)